MSHVSAGAALWSHQHHSGSATASRRVRSAALGHQQLPQPGACPQVPPVPAIALPPAAAIGSRGQSTLPPSTISKHFFLWEESTEVKWLLWWNTFQMSTQSVLHYG